VAAVFPGRNLDTCINSEEATRDQLKKGWSEFPAADRAECVSASKIGGLPSYVELLTCLQMAWDVERRRATSPETTAVGGANDLHRKRHARQQQMPAPQEGKTTRVDQKGSPDQERSAGSKSNGRQETSGQSSPSNQSSGLSQRPNAPNQSDGDLGQVPPDLDQTFSSVLQAQAELIQSAAELGVVHSYNQTPKQMLEEFEKSAPQGDIDRLFARLAAQAPAVKQAEAKLAAANRDLALAELNLRY